MNPTTEPTGNTASNNTADDEALTYQQLKSSIDALAVAVNRLDAAATISLALDPAAAKILQRLARQAREIKQIYTASAALIQLQYIRIGPNDDTAAPRPQLGATDATLAPDPVTEAASIAAWLHRFPKAANVRIATAEHGRYRVGFEYKNITYTPGPDMSYPLVEGLRRCHLEFAKQFPTDAQL